MKRPKNGSTPKQFAYAQNLLGGKGVSKKEIAQLSGFAPSVASNAKNKIENTQGFKNAIEVLAHRSNNLVLAAMAEYERRGLTEFSNKDLNGMLNAIGGAWERINKQRAPNKNETPEGNPLRKVVLQRIENQNIFEAPVPTEKDEEAVIDVEEEEDDMDF